MGSEMCIRDSFIFVFERLLRRAAAVDTDNMLRDALQASSHGFVYDIAKHHQSLAPRELASVDRTGKHIHMVPTTDALHNTTSTEASSN